MKTDYLTEMVTEALIQIFSQHEPLGLVGTEEEYLLIKENGALGSTEEVFDFFESQGLEVETDPDTDVVVAVKEDFYSIPIGSDAGANTIEINLPPCESIHDIETHLKRVLGKVQDACLATNQKILGLGIMPNVLPEQIKWQKKGRYKKIREVLFPEIDIITTTASSQTHMVFEAKNMIRALNAIMAVSGPVISITANSKVQQNKISEYACSREHVYHTFKMSQRVGMPKNPFFDIKDFARYCLEQGMFLYKEKEGDLSFKKYRGTFGSFLKDTGTKDIQTIKRHLKVHMGTLWLCVRPNPQGTIESRMCCQQPPWAQGAVHALNIGLMHNWQEVESLARSKPWDFWKKAYMQAIKDGPFACVEKIPLSDISWQVLEISEKGLQKRNKNEEVYLKDFKERLENPKKSPAFLAEKIFNKKSTAGLMERFCY